MAAKPQIEPTAQANRTPSWHLPFTPLFRNGDLQTIVARYWPVRLNEQRWPTEARSFRTEADVQVLAHLNHQPDGRASAVVLALHGLTGSTDAPYMRALTRTALATGFDVIRLNVRNCGGTEHLAPTLYHSGLTTDLRSVVEQLAPARLFLIGFSMGGNIALKLAGEWGDQVPAHVKAVCGISVPVRLANCARRIGEPRNYIYEQRFLRALRQTVALKKRLMPERFSWLSFNGVDSIYTFDDKITAPAFGFRSADHYYECSSSAAYLDKIRIPALLIQAKDDPFIPFEIFEDGVFSLNPCLHLAATGHGGHVAFLARENPRFWAARQAVSFFQSFSGVKPAV